MILGMFLGKVLAFGTLILGAMSIHYAGIARAAGPGGAGPLQGQITEFIWAGRNHWVGMLTTFAILILIVLLLPYFARWVFDRNVHRITVDTQLRMRRMRRKGRAMAIGFAAAGMLLAVAMGVLTDWALVLMILSFYTVVAGVIAIGLGLVARRGRHLACARCSYPMGSYRAAPDRCAECGNPWREPWRHTTGERFFSWRQTGGGLIAVLSGIAMQSAAQHFLMK